ncbi:hypothetical protein NDN08_002515 [Rhodosorus marinus]|uniref:SOUL heme-binding protein n=1 Tax=Rhodosorus marinus TaxID=101924 RepID=A0AAV8UTY0_9RHOD|nr:hypothetical protein NDN08_002515 [Rhodosorus marinus]
MGIVFGRIDVETPKHEVLKQENGIEIRRYPSQVAATVSASSLGDVKGKKFEGIAFGILARYIGVFSKPENVGKSGVDMTAPVLMEPNQEAKGEKIAMTGPVIMEATARQSEKIAMTGPVMMTDKTERSAEAVDMTAPVLMDESKARTMSFLLPAKYTIETAPAPTDSRVQLSEMPERVEAVIVFSGNLSTESSRAKMEELNKKLEEMHIQADASKWTMAGYNPPFCLPFMKTNEVHIPVTL